MRVALKYCGGCDPKYDRTEYFQSIAAVAEDVEWTRLDDPDYDAVLLICGCDTACIEKEMPAGVPLMLITDDQTPAHEVVQKIIEKRGT